MIYQMKRGKKTLIKAHQKENYKAKIINRKTSPSQKTSQFSKIHSKNNLKNNKIRLRNF